MNPGSYVHMGIGFPVCQAHAGREERRTFKEVAVYAAGTKEEGVVVICHNAIHQALRIQPCALRLCLCGRHNVRNAKVLQQLLALPAPTLRVFYTS